MERPQSKVGRLGTRCALWLGRKHGRLTLRELGQLSGGLNYGAVAQAVSRFGQRLQHQSELRQTVATLEKELSNV